MTEKNISKVFKFMKEESEMEQFRNLFTPIKIKNMEVKNRIFMSPMGTVLGNEKNEVTDEAVAYYAARARGGVGLITTETAIVDRLGKYFSFTNLGLYDDAQIESWRKLADEVHKYGAKLAPQLFHPATAGFPAFNENQLPIAASPIPYNVVDVVPRPLTAEEIQEYVEKFGEAARRAKEAGCDAIELHCGNRHGLLGNFLSPLHNKRVDAYGGTVDGRLKFPLEVIAKIAEKTGPDFPIIVKLGITDMAVGGQSLIETCYIAKRMEEAGVAMFHLQNGNIETDFNVISPSGGEKAINADLAEKIRQAISVPVGFDNRINEPWTAEMVLSLNKADVTYMGRALLCDPEFPNKAQSGRCEEIRPCIGCVECFAGLTAGKGLHCTMNPFVGKEAAPVTRADKSKRILVIGGGPGGLEAAGLAAQRGHDVTLMEKSDRLGGNMYIAAFPPAKQDIAHGTKYLIEQAVKNGVKIELNKTVTPEVVREFAPDEIVLAVGGKPVWPKWLHNDEANIVSSWDVLEGKCNTGKRILVIGGSLVGCETADFLAHPFNDRCMYGKKVTLIEMMPEILMEDRSSNRSLLVRRLQDKGVQILTGARVEEVLSDGITYTQNGESVSIHGFDTIVAALGTQPENSLLAELEGIDIPIHVIGDAKQARKIIDATAEGAEVALNL